MTMRPSAPGSQQTGSARKKIRKGSKDILDWLLLQQTGCWSLYFDRQHYSLLAKEHVPLSPTKDGAALSTDRASNVAERNPDDGGEERSLIGLGLVGLLAALNGTGVALATTAGERGGSNKGGHGGGDEESELGEHCR
jgi:hypothetical protein